MEDKEIIKKIEDTLENYSSYSDRSRSDKCVFEVNYHLVADDILKIVKSYYKKGFGDGCEHAEPSY